VDAEQAVEQKNATILTSLITSLITVIATLLLVTLWFQPLENIKLNKQNLKQDKLQIEEIRQSITISRQDLEQQVRDYITNNYGELSERDEKVDKLLIYFRQQDARLTNIEKALSKF